MILFHHRAVEARFAKTGYRGWILRPFEQGYEQQKEAVNGRIKNYHVKMEGFNSFSDGIVAVLFTILVLDLRSPTFPTSNAAVVSPAIVAQLCSELPVRCDYIGQPRRPFPIEWVLLDNRFVPEEGRRCGPRPLLGLVMIGFQRCNVPVHKNYVLAGFGRTRVKLVVIEKERSRCRRKRHEEVRNSAGRVPLLQ